MDSVVGSVYLAYWLSETVSTLHVPLLNFPKRDLPLRNDVLQVLQSHSVDVAALLSVVADGETPGAELVDIAALHEADSVAAATSESTNALGSFSWKLFLYDHNKLTSLQHSLLPRVAGIVDHHADEKLCLDCSLRVVAKVGSACTLVEELFHKKELSVPQPELLLGTIALDTMNFDPAFKKTTPRDESARDRLLDVIDPAPSSEGDSKDGDVVEVGKRRLLLVNALYEKLNTWKFDTLSLTVPQSLRRDYKCFALPSKGSSGVGAVGEGRVVRVGISSILLLEAEALEHYTAAVWWSACESFLHEQRIDALLVMYAANDSNGTFTRQLSVLGPKWADDLVAAFAESSREDVGLVRLACHAAEVTPPLACTSYAQRDATVSRKGLTPLFGEFVAQSHL